MSSQTNLFPLKNELACVSCHAGQVPILGILLISFSREEIVNEIKASTGGLALSLFSVILVMGGMLYFFAR